MAFQCPQRLAMPANTGLTLLESLLGETAGWPPKLIWL